MLKIGVDSDMTVDEMYGRAAVDYVVKKMKLELKKY